jgi:hypothetical protein
LLTEEPTVRTLDPPFGPPSTLAKIAVYFGEKGVMLDMYLQYHNTLCLFWQIVYVRHIYIQKIFISEKEKRKREVKDKQ